jgi:hypothetical protein
LNEDRRLTPLTAAAAAATTTTTTTTARRRCCCCSRVHARARPAAPQLTSWDDERRGAGRSEVVGVQQPEWDETIASLLTDEPPILRADGGELFF